MTIRNNRRMSLFSHSHLTSISIGPSSSYSRDGDGRTYNWIFQRQKGMRLGGYKRTVVVANDRKTAVNQRARGGGHHHHSVHSLLLLSIITFLVGLFSLLFLGPVRYLPSQDKSGEYMMVYSRSGHTPLFFFVIFSSSYFSFSAVTIYDH
jgi:hypothetical protein